MTVDLTALDAATKALLADPKAAATVKKYATANTAVLHAMQPPAGSGLGLLMYGGKLATCSHRTDGTYEAVVADNSDADVLAQVGGKGFAYWDSQKLDLSQPVTFASDVLVLQAQHPFAGVFLDNVSYPQAATLVPFLTTLRPLLAGKCLLMANVSGFGVYNDPRNFNGVAQTEWIGKLTGLADYMMAENWQQAVAGAAQYGNLRTRGTSNQLQFWDAWQGVIAATHAAGARFAGLTYGRTAATDPATPIERAIYGRASSLVAPSAAPGDVFFYNNGDGITSTGTDPYDPAWTKPSLSPTVNPVPPVSATL